METETGISEVLLPKNGESDELCRETERGDQVEITKNAIMIGNHGTSKDARISASLPDQAASNEADQDGKAHEVLNSSEDSKSGEAINKVSVDRNAEVVMDRHEIVEDALGHKVEAPETTAEKSVDVEVSEEKGRVSDAFLASEDTETEKERNEISLDTGEDEKTEVPENELVDLPAVCLLVEQAEVVNGNNNKEVREESGITGTEKATESVSDKQLHKHEEDESLNPIYEETRAVISKEEVLESKSVQDKPQEDEKSYEEVIEETRSSGAHDSIPCKVNEYGKDSGLFESSVENKEVEDESHEHKSMVDSSEEQSFGESVSQLKNRDQPGVSVEEKKVEISEHEAPKSEGDVQNNEQPGLINKMFNYFSKTENNEEIDEEATLYVTDSTREETSKNTPDEDKPKKEHAAETIEEESVSQLKDRDQHEVSADEKKVEIFEDEGLKSEGEVQKDEPSAKAEQGIVEEVSRSTIDSAQEETSAKTHDDDKSHAVEIIAGESKKESKDQDPNEVSVDEKKIEVYTEEAMKSEGEVQSNEKPLRLEEEIIDKVTRSTTLDKALDEEKLHDESAAEITEEESGNKLEDLNRPKVSVKEKKVEIKSERDVESRDQSIKLEDRTTEEVPLSTNFATQEEPSDDKEDKAQDEEKAREETTTYIIEEESADILKGEDPTEVSAEGDEVEISKDEALKSESEVQGNEQTGLMNKMFGYFSKKESNEPTTRVEEEINKEVTVSTTESTQDKAADIIEEESANESKEQDPTEASIKEDKDEISIDHEAPESEGEVHHTEKTGLMNKMFGYFSKKESEEVTTSAPEFQQEIKEERKTEIINEEAEEKSKDREVEAEMSKEEIVVLETPKAPESSPRDMNIEGDIIEDRRTEIVNEEATEKPKDQETRAQTSNEEVDRVLETPKATECFVEASSEKREDSPHEEVKPQGQVEDPVESPKDVNDYSGKVEAMTEENETESSEKVDRDIQYLKESPEEKEVTEVETSESVECKNADDALETLVVARSDETIGEVPLSTASATREETTDEKQEKALYEDKSHEESTADIIEEESADKLKIQDPTEVSAKISKDEALKSEGEVQSNEQPGIMNKMFGYFSKKENIETTTRVEEEVTVFNNDSTHDKAAEIIEEESANKLKDQEYPTEVSVMEDEISNDEAPNSEGEHTSLVNKMFGYFSKKESEEVTISTPKLQQEAPRGYTEEMKEEIKEESKTEIVNEEATETLKDREIEAENSNEEVSQVLGAPKAIECSAEASSEKQEESPKEDAEPQNRVEDQIHSVAAVTSSVESLKDVYGDPNKIELITEENKTESSEIVDRDVQNLQESSETEISDNVDQKPNSEKEIAEVEASESVQCKNTEDALETIVVAPSEEQEDEKEKNKGQDSMEGTLNKGIAVSYTGEEDSQQANEETELGENRQTSVIVTSKDTKTEPSSETTDTEKVDERISYDTSKDVESSTDPLYPAGILREERKIEDTLYSDVAKDDHGGKVEAKGKEEEQTVKAGETGEKLEELPQVVAVKTESVENVEETIETEKKEEKTREIDEAAKIIEEECAKEVKDQDPTDVSVDRNKVEISKDEAPKSDREAQNTEQTGLINKMFGYFSKKESEEATVSAPEFQQEIKEERTTETVNEEASEKPRDRETEAETSNEEIGQIYETPKAIECAVEDQIENVAQESPETEKSELVDHRTDLEKEVTETASGSHDITEQVSREIDFAEDTKEFQVIGVPSYLSRDENVEESSEELEKEVYTPKPESLIKEEVAEEETQEGKTSWTEIKSDHGAVVQSGDVSAEISGEEQREIEIFEALNEEKDLPIIVNPSLLLESVVAEPASEETSSRETWLKEEKPEDEERIKSFDLGSLSDIVPKEVEQLDEAKSDSVSHHENDQVKISDLAPIQSDSVSSEAVSETTLSKEDKELIERLDIGSRSITSSEDLGLKKPEPDTASEEVASSYDLGLKEVELSGEVPIKSNNIMVPEVKLDSDDRVQTSDIAPVETEEQHVSEGTTSKITKVESEALPSDEDAIVARDRDRDIDTRSNSASDEVDSKEDDKPIYKDQQIRQEREPIYKEQQTRQERENEIPLIARLSVDDSTEESGPSKGKLMELSKQEGDSKVVSNVNEETQELISRDTILPEVHGSGYVQEGIESEKIEESIKSEEVFEERNSSQIIAEVKETNPNELKSDSPVEEYVAEKNEESVTIVTEPKEENESIVIEERSFGFSPEMERKNIVEEVKLASDTKLNKETEKTRAVEKDEVVADRDLPVRVSTEPIIRVSPDEESESKVTSVVQKVAEEERKTKETEILDDEKTKDSLAKEKPKEPNIAEVEIVEKLGSRIEEQEAESEVKDAADMVTGSDSQNAHVADRDLIRALSSTLAGEELHSEYLDDNKTKDSSATTKQVAEEFKTEEEVKVLEEAELEVNDLAVRTVSGSEERTASEPSHEKKDENGLTKDEHVVVSTKEIPETKVLSVTEKEYKDEPKKLEISESPKVIREVETREAHSPTEKDKAGSPEPKTNIEDVQIIEDHLKIATIDGKEELSTEYRPVKARDTEAPTEFEEISQRDSKPELVSLSGLAESPKEDTEHKKCEHSTDQGTEEPNKKKKIEGENDGHNEEEEQEDEEEEEEEDDASTSVQPSKDGEAKASKKKSHGLFSGVGSKVKHSISKVKKAITGKSSNNTKDAVAK